MQEYLRAIFVHEFEAGSFGLKTSEFTKDIIESEIERLTKSKKVVDFTKADAYIIIINQSGIKLIGFSSLNDAIESATGLYGDTYVIHRNGILVINSQDKKGIETSSLKTIEIDSDTTSD